MTIEATDVVKKFGHVTAVNGISLSVPRGQIMALLGKNGAGKTTFIDIVLGLQAATEGRVQVFGMSPRDAIRRSLVGVVHQTGALQEEYTVSQCLRLFAAAHASRADLDTVLAETQLTHLARRTIRKLSGGEKQRVRLALALLPDPQLLILDEPTAGMDATARREFWDLMRHQADRGRTIIFATHYLAEAETFAQRTVVIKDGRVVADGETDELRRATAVNTVRVLVPASDEATAHAALAALGDADIRSVESAPYNGSGDVEFVVRTTASDTVARALLAIASAHSLEVTASSLEDTFAQLTA